MAQLPAARPLAARPLAARLSSFAALACAAFVPPGAAHATGDLTIPVVVCVPGDPVTMNAETKLLTAGVIRKEGRNTPPLMFYCPVNNDLTAAQPSWRQLRLTTADHTGTRGNVSVRLFAKSRARRPTDPPLGTTFKVAQVWSQPSATVSTASVALPAALDFDRFSYWLVLEVGSLAGSTAKIDVHDIQLTD